MPHKFLDEHQDVVQVILAHAAAIGVTFLDVEFFLKIMSLSLAISYTAWKWIVEYNKYKIKSKK